MIERNERVLVLIENEPGEEPWMHRRIRSPRRRRTGSRRPRRSQAPDSCAPNRGGDAGSLLLVNHWVDTSPAPRKTIARAVNARAVLGARLERCRQERKLLPNIVAVDFYRDGDVFAPRRGAQMTDPITRGLHDLREECIAQAEPGRVADYIPELQYADPRSVRDRAGKPRG